jgi:hypothetical protein
MATDTVVLDDERYLAIYLQDHRAGAEVGVRLARRCRDHAPDGTTTAELTELVTDIEQDRASLAALMASLGVTPSSFKQLAGTGAELLGRLKLNGRLVRRSPLSVLLELEGLVGAVSTKRQLWATLAQLPATARCADIALESMTARADDQRQRLHVIHVRLVRELLSGGATTGRDGGAAEPST